jgi:hypothetical protein
LYSSADIIRKVKLRRTDEAERVSSMREMRYAYKIVVGKTSKEELC